MKIYKILIVFLLISVHSYSLNFFTNGKSTALCGADSSVADGFNAMLFNPAGIYMTDSKYGFDFLGSYGIRYYSNSLTTDDILDFLLALKLGENLTEKGAVDDLLKNIPEYGFEFGTNISIANIMVYNKINDFSLGISFIPKTSATLFGEKKILSYLFEGLDLTKKLSFSTKFALMQYFDLNFSLSTRAKFLEEKLKIDKIFTGLSTHIYLPVFFVRSNSSMSIENAGPNEDGVIDQYRLRADTDMIVGGYGMGFLTNIPFFKDNYGDTVLKNRAFCGFGLGIDLGFILKFNTYIKLGFAITDLGFILFPNAVHSVIHENKLAGFDSIGNVSNDLIDALLGKSHDANIEEKATVWMPDTAIRLGVGITPLKNSDLLVILCDLSLSDFNRILNQDYLAFSISTGLEINPGYKWFKAPIRVAFNYNTLANVGSFSLGLGLYFGPVHLDIGVKGLEIFLYELGAREFCLAFDLTFVH